MNGHSKESIMNGSSMDYFLRSLWRYLKMPLILLKIEEIFVLLECPNYSEEHPI